MNYTFSNLLGAPYRGGSLVLHRDTLICPAGNRVREVALRDAVSSAYPFQNPHQIQTIALSPDGGLILTVDTEGRALVALRSTRVLLHRFTVKGTCRAAAFSPDGSYVAIAAGKLLWVWRAPPRRKLVSPMQLHRRYGGCFDDITHVTWSQDSRWIAVASRDITARVFSLHPTPRFVPPTLAGHRASLVAIFFASVETKRAAALLDGVEPPDILTLSSDGALHMYTFTPEVASAQKRRHASGSTEDEGAAANDDMHGDPSAEPVGALTRDEAVNGAGETVNVTSESDTTEADWGAYAYGTWHLSGKHYFMQPNAALTAADYHGPSGLLVTTFSNGCFLLHSLPAFEHLQTLSVSRERLSAVSFNESGDWIALGAAALGQLLVWEWRSETYVLKQQGHYHDVATVAFSPDGTYLASGADDAKVKVWLVASGFCFVTFDSHTSAVTGVTFTPNGNAVLSSSLDGTVRAFDLVRYRNFRTFTAAEPVQFGCVAIEAGGEIVCAGSRDSFQIYLWNIRTSQLLDLIAGHEGPIVGLSFNPSNTTLATASWDKTARIFDAYGGKGGGDVLQHSHEVLAVAFDPTGKHVCVSTLNGELSFWDAENAELLGVIEARRDLRRGRLMTDRRTAGNMSSGQAFTSITYSADGALLIAAGNCKWVCMYDVAERVLLRRFELSRNLALDGVRDQLNSRNVTDAGPLDLLDVDDDEDNSIVLPPSTAGGAAAADKLPGTTGGQKKAVLRCHDLALALDGTKWAAATTEGILLYSLTNATTFDPTDLAEDISVPNVHKLLGLGAPLKALLVATRLGDVDLTRHVVMTVPHDDIRGVAASLPAPVVLPTLAALASALGTSPHLQYVLTWLRALCDLHAEVLSAAPRTQLMPAVRELQRGLEVAATHLAPSVQSVLYSLSYLRVVATVGAQQDPFET